MSVKDTEPGPSRPVVTLAALYGAGGTVVGPRVAERLGVPFLDRGILTAVAKRLGVQGRTVNSHLRARRFMRRCRCLAVF